MNIYRNVPLQVLGRASTGGHLLKLSFSVRLPSVKGDRKTGNQITCSVLLKFHSY